MNASQDIGLEIACDSKTTPPASLSVVVPVYSGAEYLERLVEAILEVQRDWESRKAPVSLCEIILVDDAAIDGSPEVIDRLQASCPEVTALHLSRNFGQHAATMVGILHSSGEWIVSLDEDLQHRPEHVLDLFEKAVTENLDVVYARPASKVHEAAMRDMSSRGFKRFMKWVTDNPNLTDFNSFRLLRGPVARAAASVCTHDTYLDIALSWFTQRVGVVRIEMKDERFIKTGKSGYRLRSLISHAWKMLFSSQIKLLRLGALLGLGVMGLSGLGAIYFLALKIFFPEDIGVQGWTSLFLAVSFFGGVTVFMVGIALQYLSTLVLKAHGKPTFFTIDRSGDRAHAAWFPDRS